MKNYYMILNVKPTATEEDIKRSYRVLAKKYHPDVNPGDDSAAERFAEVNEAHSVLSDPQKRAEYDAKFKEASAPHGPEDIIARQRAQAQAAARQAAMRNRMRQQAQATAAARQSAATRTTTANRTAGTRTTATTGRTTTARQSTATRTSGTTAGRTTANRAGYNRASAMGHPNSTASRGSTVNINMSGMNMGGMGQQGAMSHPGTMSQPSDMSYPHGAYRAQMGQAQAQAAQAQINALKAQAYQMGYDHAVADVTAEAEKEINKLHTEVQKLTVENEHMKEEIAEIEHDRSDLEQELFNRDRELKKAETKNAELESQLERVKQQAAEASALATSRAKAELDKMRELLEKSRAKVKQLEQQKSQAEIKSNAQLQVYQEKRKQLQQRVEELSKQNFELRSEMDSVLTENNQWQQYAKSEQFLSDTERRLEDWDQKQKADKKLAKPTLYGTLGVLIWATDVEIEAAYNKLVKRYSSKTDDASVAKLKKINDAYTVLSDPKKRAEYNATIDITDERIATERKLIIDTENIKKEYRDRLESKEFWAWFDELMFSAQTGDADAQNSLGEMYYFGDEIEQDFDQAVYWFKEAAKQKHAEAMYNLGVCFVNGEGVDKNKTTGLGFIRQAAKLGSKAAKQYKNNA